MSGTVSLQRTTSALGLNPPGLTSEQSGGLPSRSATGASAMVRLVG